MTASRVRFVRVGVVKAVKAPAPAAPAWRSRAWNTRAWRVRAAEVGAQAAPILATGAALLAVLLGCLCLASNVADAYRLPGLALLALSLLLLISGLARARLAAGVTWTGGAVDPVLLLLLGLTLMATCVLGAMPEYVGRAPVNALFHRSAVSALLLFAVGLPAACASLYYLLGATPSAEDASRYPVIVLPVFLASAAYGLLLSGLLVRGVPQLDREVITRPFLSQFERTLGTSVQQSGFSNHILGTLLLMALTALFSLPVGVGSGVFVSEFTRGFLSGAVRFTTTALRGISVFVLGLTAVRLVEFGRGGPFSMLFTGSYVSSASGQVTAGQGSFLVAAAVISLLVIPLISRATEEGCRSVPEGLREGSLALGASDEYTLRRIVLPWAMPNITTALLLGCAEAAGSVATIMFIARAGEHGVTGPWSEVTSLAYAVFAGQYYYSRVFPNLMGPAHYQYAGAVLLLLITLTLTIAGLVVKSRYAGRYRGA